MKHNWTNRFNQIMIKLKSNQSINYLILSYFNKIWTLDSNLESLTTCANISKSGNFKWDWILKSKTLLTWISEYNEKLNPYIAWAQWSHKHLKKKKTLNDHRNFRKNCIQGKNNRSIPLVYINRSNWQRHMHKAEWPNIKVPFK